LWLPLAYVVARWAPWLELWGPGLSEVVAFFALLATVILVGWNLWAAIREAYLAGRVLAAIPLTTVQLLLFTLLFFQIGAHLGAKHYVWSRPPAAFDWLMFSIAHAARATDVIDGVEAYGLHIQTIRNASHLTSLALVLYHLVVTVFVMSLIIEHVNRAKTKLLSIPYATSIAKTICGLLATLLVASWLISAFWLRPWQTSDILLWPLDNLLRVVDVADLFEIYQVRLHRVPVLPWESTLTFTCRILLSLAAASALGRYTLVARLRWLKGFALTNADLVELASSENDRVSELAGARLRELASTPTAPPFQAYWVRPPMVAAGAALVLATAAAFLVTPWNPPPIVKLAETSVEPTPWVAHRTLNSLRRLGMSADEAAPILTAGQAGLSIEQRLDIIDTLGHLGPAAAPYLESFFIDSTRDIRLAAVRALMRIGPRASMSLVMGLGADDAELREACRLALAEFGYAGVQMLVDNIDAENAIEVVPYLTEADPYWKRRRTDNDHFAQVIQAYDLTEPLARAGASNAELERVIGEVKSMGPYASMHLPRLLKIYVESDSLSSLAWAALNEVAPNWRKTRHALDAAVELSRRHANGDVSERDLFHDLSDIGRINDAIAIHLQPDLQSHDFDRVKQTARFFQKYDPDLAALRRTTAQVEWRSNDRMYAMIALQAHGDAGLQEITAAHFAALTTEPVIHLRPLAEFLLEPKLNLTSEVIEFARSNPKEIAVAVKFANEFDPVGDTLATLMHGISPDATERMAQLLSHPDPVTQSLGQLLLTKFDTGQAGLHTLVETVLTKQGTLRYAALETLAATDDDAIYLRSVLTRSDSLEPEINQPPKPHEFSNKESTDLLVALMREAFAKEDREVQKYLVLAAHELGAKASPLSGMLMNALGAENSKNATVDQQYLWDALIAIDPEGVAGASELSNASSLEPFIKVLECEASPQVRQLALAVLSAQPVLGREFVPRLTTVLLGDNAEFGRAAATALLSVDPELDLTALEFEKRYGAELMSRFVQFHARNDVGDLLEKLTEKHRFTAEDCRELLQLTALSNASSKSALALLAHWDASANISAAQLTEPPEIVDPDLLADYAKVMTDSERIYAVRLLGRMKRTTRLPLIVDWYRNGSPETSRNAGIALRLIDSDRWAQENTAIQTHYLSTLEDITGGIGSLQEAPTSFEQEERVKRLNGAPIAHRCWEWNVLANSFRRRGRHLIPVVYGEQMTGWWFQGDNEFAAAILKDKSAAIEIFRITGGYFDSSFDSSRDPDRTIEVGKQAPMTASSSAGWWATSIWARGNGALDTRGQVRIVPFDSSGELQEWSGGTSHSLASPSGKFLAYRNGRIVNCRNLSRENSLYTETSWSQSIRDGVFSDYVRTVNLAFSRNERVFAWVHATKSIGVRKLSPTGDEEEKFYLPTPLELAGNIAVSPEGKFIAIEMRRNTHVWDVNSRQKSFIVNGGHPAFSPDGLRLATSLDNAIFVTDTKSRKVICRLQPEKDNYSNRSDFESGFRRLEFSPDGRYLAAGHKSGVIVLNGEPPPNGEAGFDG